MARVISVVNQKGGTGKTTTVISIAAYLAKKGFKTLIADMEPQANATLYLGLDPELFEISMYEVLLRESVDINDIILTTNMSNLDLAPAQVSLAKTDLNLANASKKQFRLKDKLFTARMKYDYIVIDCPPSLSLLPINALAASDEVIIPLQPEYLSLEGLKQLSHSLERAKTELNPHLKTLGILFTMVDMRTRMTRHSMGLVKDYYGDLVFNTKIRLCSKFNEAPIMGQSIFEYDPKSKGAEDYRSLTEEILKREAAFTTERLIIPKQPSRIGELLDAV